MIIALQERPIFKRLVSLVHAAETNHMPVVKASREKHRTPRSGWLPRVEQVRRRPRLQEAQRETRSVRVRTIDPVPPTAGQVPLGFSAQTVPAMSRCAQLTSFRTNFCRKSAAVMAPPKRGPVFFMSAKSLLRPSK
mmetsp:Transcript_108066/g.262604  ORF Transcript_108066/g.262604 Transcript_108066/m.262604 type:complete len:136 (+) Transcript_108066:29-436(+)